MMYCTRFISFSLFFLKIIFLFCLLIFPKQKEENLDNRFFDYQFSPYLAFIKSVHYNTPYSIGSVLRELLVMITTGSVDFSPWRPSLLFQ